MKYALKITRDTREGQITVLPVMEVPDDTEGYRLKHKHGRAEGLWIYDTRDAAEEACDAEAFAAVFALESDAELTAILKECVLTCRQAGVSAPLLYRWCNVRESTLNRYIYQGTPPEPRTVAKISMITREIENIVEKYARILPIDGGCGKTRKARGGHPDLWKKSPSARRKAQGKQ